MATQSFRTPEEEHALEEALGPPDGGFAAAEPRTREPSFRQAAMQPKRTPRWSIRRRARAKQ